MITISFSSIITNPESSVTKSSLLFSKTKDVVCASKSFKRGISPKK